MNHWSKVAAYPIYQPVPSGARVDAEQFPEDEFPVHCSSCDYLLRGLQDPRCPECGLSFDRGRLLVDQYIRQKSGRMRRWSRRWLWFLLVSSFFIGGLPLLFTHWPQTIPSAQWRKWTWTITAVGWTTYGIGLLTFATVAIRDIIRTRSQRRRILAALRASGGAPPQASESRLGC